MNENAALLDKISGKFFMAGFFISKIKLIASRAFVPVIDLIVLSAYLAGYSAWYLATLFYPHHPRQKNAWYSFSSFRQQYQASALLGALATLLFLTQPALSLPATWLYTLSNITWLIGEYHKSLNPPSYNKNYSSERQAVYLHYVTITTSVSLLNAVAATIAFVFPAAAGISFLSATIVGNLLTIGAFYYYHTSTSGEFKPDSESYLDISERLSDKKSLKVHNLNNDAPTDEHPASFEPLWASPTAQTKEPLTQTAPNSNDHYPKPG